MLILECAQETGLSAQKLSPIPSNARMEKRFLRAEGGFDEYLEIDALPVELPKWSIQKEPQPAEQRITFRRLNRAMWEYWCIMGIMGTIPEMRIFQSPKRLPLVAPSILSADFAAMGDECRRVLDAGADLLHLDVMDGHFVPNLTMGPALCQSLRASLPEVFLDVHLMVEWPADFVDLFADAGADHLTFHIEVVDDPVALSQTIRNRGMSVGLAINPPTDVDRIMKYVEHFDLILVMSVNPGFSGQSFIESVIDKTQAISSRLRSDQRLEMDGGINSQSVTRCREAGCDVLVAASAIFGTDDYETAVTMLRGNRNTKTVTASIGDVRENR